MDKEKIDKLVDNYTVIKPYFSNNQGILVISFVAFDESSKFFQEYENDERFIKAIQNFNQSILENHEYIRDKYKNANHIDKNKLKEDLLDILYRESSSNELKTKLKKTLYKYLGNNSTNKHSNTTSNLTKYNKVNNHDNMFNIKNLKKKNEESNNLKEINFLNVDLENNIILLNDKKFKINPTYLNDFKQKIDTIYDKGYNIKGVKESIRKLVKNYFNNGLLHRVKEDPSFENIEINHKNPDHKFKNKYNDNDFSNNTSISRSFIKRHLNKHLDFHVKIRQKIFRDHSVLFESSKDNIFEDDTLEGTLTDYNIIGLDSCGAAEDYIVELIVNKNDNLNNKIIFIDKNGKYIKDKNSFYWEKTSINDEIIKSTLIIEKIN